MVGKIKMKIAITVLFAVLLGGVTPWYYTPKYFPTPFKKPVPAERKMKYEYYEILDESTGEPLMYVSVVDVTKGDELLVEDRWYVIVKVVGNRAYARQFEKK
jgi:hypothetical protein